MFTDPVFAAIERHRLADTAVDDALERRGDEMAARYGEERTALIDLLRTKPETLAGCLAAMRYVADLTEINDAGLFSQWGGPCRSAGAAFLPMIAGAIEAVTR
jgi:hypothetical protein